MLTTARAGAVDRRGRSAAEPCPTDVRQLVNAMAVVAALGMVRGAVGGGVVAETVRCRHDGGRRSGGGVARPQLMHSQQADRHQRDTSPQQQLPLMDCEPRTPTDTTRLASLDRNTQGGY